VTITGKEIYDAVVRLTGRVDVLIKQQEELTQDIKDHETRLRSLERARWPLPSLSILLAAFSLMVAIASKI
jgi:hypothetical protein